MAGSKVHESLAASLVQQQEAGFTGQGELNTLCCATLELQTAVASTTGP